MKALARRIRPAIRTYRRASYGHLDEMVVPRRGPLIDCHLGTNPYGMAPSAASYLEAAEPSDIGGLARYPPYPYDELRTALARYWEPVAQLAAESFLVGVGSYGLLCLVAQMMLGRGSRVLGCAPQYSDYPDTFRTYGARYEVVMLRDDRDRGGKWLMFDAEELASRIDETHTFVYIDNPNNPTGQVIPLEDIEHVVSRALRIGVPVVVDEAYGDFMPKENSAIGLVNQYENLVVVRSFSKAFGLAGLRVGYGVFPEWLMIPAREIDALFQVNSLGLAASIRALRDEAFLKSCRSKCAAFKESLSRVPGLTISQTSGETPICVIADEKGDRNLHERLLELGVRTTPGSGFRGLDDSCVRLRVPASEHEADLLERLSVVVAR